jgi:trehalose 2-sulfotransferase
MSRLSRWVRNRFGWEKRPAEMPFPFTHSLPPRFKKPEKTILIASSPRSGSNLLCHHMAATHSLGYPDEYFNTVIFKQRRPQQTCSPDAMLNVALEDGFSPNNILSIKVHAWQMREVGERLALEKSLPGVRWIHIDRADRLGQAISLEIARQTGEWHSLHPKGTEPAYDTSAISARIEELERDGRFWNEFFKARGIEPFRLTYENFAAKPACAIRGIARFCEARLCTRPIRALHNSNRPSHLSGMKKQRSALNQQWRERYLASTS